MIKKAINNFQQRLEQHLRLVCGRLTPGKRVAVILTMLALFGGASIYMTVAAIYNFGKDKGRRLEIERIESLKLESQSHPLQPEPESINQQNEYEY